MKKAYLIYENKEAQKNHGFIEMFQQTGKEKGIDFSFVSKTDYQTFSEKINPDFVLNRTRDPEVSRWYEERNIPVYHNSRLVELANHKYKMMTYFQEHLPEKILNEKWCPATVFLTVPAQMERFLVSDELTLPAGQPTPETILCVSTVPEITERRIVGSKAVFKGSAEIRILYQATDGSICAVSQTFPFSQYCQLAGDYDEEQLRLCMAVTSCDAELPTEGGTMAVSAGLLAQCLVTKTVTLPFCEDAFATHGTLQAEWKEFTFDCQLDRQVQQLALRDTLRGEPLRSVIDSAVFVDFPRTEPVEQGVRVTVPVNVRVLGLDAEGMMQGLSGAARAETELPAECWAVCRASAALRPEGSASPSGDGAELRAALTMDAGFFAQQTLRTLSAGTIDPPAEPEARRPSRVIRAGLDGGPVWDVAKQYGTSVAAICAANGLSGEEIEAGGMLLIPM